MRPRDVDRSLIGDTLRSLSDVETRVARLVSLTSGPFGHTIGAALGRSAEDTLSTCYSLAAKDILKLEGPDTFAMHALVAEEIGRLTPSDERRALHGLYAKYLRERGLVVEALDQAIASQQTALAIQFLDDAYGAMVVRGRYGRLKSLGLRLLALPELSDAVRGRALMMVGYGLFRQGRPRQAFGYYTRSEASLRRAGRVDELVDVAYHRAYIKHLLELERPAYGIARSGQALSLSLPPNSQQRIRISALLAHLRGHRDPVAASGILGALTSNLTEATAVNVEAMWEYANSLVGVEAYEQAAAVCDKVLMIASNIQYHPVVAYALWRKADIALHSGEIDDAERWAVEAERIFTRLGEGAVRYVLRTRAEIAKMRGQYDEALGLYDRAMRHAKAVKGLPDFCALIGMSDIERLQGRLPLRTYLLLLTAHLVAGSTWGAVNVALIMGLAFWDRGSRGVARRSMTLALQMLARGSDRWNLETERRIIVGLLESGAAGVKFPLIYI